VPGIDVRGRSLGLGGLPMSRVGDLVSFSDPTARLITGEAERSQRVAEFVVRDRSLGLGGRPMCGADDLGVSQAPRVGW
jgi:hypothetical protein